MQNVVSTLINVVKLDVQNNNMVSTLSNVVNINVETDNVNVTLFNVVNLNVNIHGIPEFLERNSWTLNATVGRWTLDVGLWTLSLTVVERNQNPVSDFA